MLGPLDVVHVGERGAVPREPRRAAAGGGDDAELHVGVRRAGARVAERRRRLIGVAGVGDVEGIDLALVGALVEELRRVGRPPVAACAIELLLRDELGGAVRDVGPVLPGEAARLAAGGVRDPQIAVAQEPDPLAVGRQARIVGIAGAEVERARRPARAVEEEDLRAERDEQLLPVLGGLHADDAADARARALAARLLGGGELDVVGGDEVRRGGELANLLRVGVELEQLGDRRARAGAEEEDVAVGEERDDLRRAEAVVARGGEVGDGLGIDRRRRRRRRRCRRRRGDDRLRRRRARGGGGRRGAAAGEDEREGGESLHARSIPREV